MPEGGSLDVDEAEGANRHSHSREDFHWFCLYAEASGFHAHDRFQQVHIQPSLTEIPLTEHSHVRSDEILQDTKSWNDLQPPYSKKTCVYCKSEKRRATQFINVRSLYCKLFV